MKVRNAEGKRRPEYQAYMDAKRRCTKSELPNYKDYGGRGIEFRYKNFREFVQDVGLRPSPDYSLDRTNNDGHYEPGNCRWATYSEQSANRRSLREAGRPAANYGRYKKGVSVEKGKFRARIWINGKRVHLGTFATEDEAHKAYCDKYKEITGHDWPSAALTRKARLARD